MQTSGDSPLACFASMVFDGFGSFVSSFGTGFGNGGFLWGLTHSHSGWGFSTFRALDLDLDLGVDCLDSVHVCDLLLVVSDELFQLVFVRWPVAQRFGPSLALRRPV